MPEIIEREHLVMFQNVISRFRQNHEAHNPGLTTSFPSLQEQQVTSAETNVKIHLAIVGTAMVDALGGPAEFHKRFTFELVTSMLPNDNFRLGPGVWTDDTSMTLCLARSLATFELDSSESPKVQGGFDPKHQLDAYLNWSGRGELSAIGRCFDIGATISRALSIYQSQIKHGDIDQALQAIQVELGGEMSSGNGSLMRVLPIGLAYWKNEEIARRYARRSSVTTHPNSLCQEACEVWTGAIVRILQASQPERRGTKYTKIDLLDYFVNFPYQNDVLRAGLALPEEGQAVPATSEEREAHYRKYHPVLRLVDSQQSQAASEANWVHLIPNEGDLPSSGYVLHSLVAALYCFLATKSFEEGAILAVNLGNDADTVGAIYGGLAGCWYAATEKPKEGDLFWGHAVKQWRKDLVARDLVEKVASELVQAQERFSQAATS